eukprot:scaffold131823_cov31-Tisochrysis_lutea.AAC.5
MQNDVRTERKDGGHGRCRCSRKAEHKEHRAWREVGRPAGTVPVPTRGENRDGGGLLSAFI